MIKLTVIYDFNIEGQNYINLLERKYGKGIKEEDSITWNNPSYELKKAVWEILKK